MARTNILKDRVKELYDSVYSEEYIGFRHGVLIRLHQKLCNIKPYPDPKSEISELITSIINLSYDIEEMSSDIENSSKDKKIRAEFGKLFLNLEDNIAMLPSK